MFDGIKKINVPAARAEILKSIATYRVRAQIARIVEDFMWALPPAKRIDKRTADKLHTTLIDAGVKVGYVRLTTKVVVQQEWMFTIKAFDVNQDIHFTFRSSPQFGMDEAMQREFDILQMMIGDRLWEKHANHLQDTLVAFARRAGKFNELLDQLRDAAQLAKPADSLFPIHPYSDYFSWYELEQINAGV